jgi:hypothetical protein
VFREAVRARSQTAEVDDPPHAGLVCGLAENPAGLPITRGEILAAHRVDQIVDDQDTIEGPGHGRRVERVACGDVGRGRRAVAQRLGAAHEATH